MLKESMILGAVFVLALVFGFTNYSWAGKEGLVGLWKKDATNNRKKAAHRKRRIIVNNDGNDVRFPLHSNKPITAKDFLKKRFEGLQYGSHVDTIFYCTGVFNLYSHKSSVSELHSGPFIWEVYEFSKSYAKYLGKRKERQVSKELIEETGKDSLEIATEFCHKHDLEIFWSMRMNDVHDAYIKSLLPQWKKDHPHCLMGKPGQTFPRGGFRYWSSLNYALKEVRDKVFQILEDVSTRYDIDGIELDFYRHPVYFKPHLMGESVTQEHCDMITALLQRVRDMADKLGKKRGRPLLISVRVPDSVDCSKAIGLDITKWMENDLIDILVGGGYAHHEPLENLVSLGKEYDVPVYACLSGSRLVSSSQPVLKGDIKIWRGEALKAWEAGVSGIYTFNRFNPEDPLFWELGDPALLKKLEHTYQHRPGSIDVPEPKGGKRFYTIRQQK